MKINSIGGHMNTKRILGILLTVIMLLGFAACSEPDSPERTENTKSPAASEIGDVYKLPAGARSEYELYKTVVNYLNNGFHLGDLKDVYDQNLSYTYASKLVRNPAENFTLGMQYEDACALIARLRDIVSELRSLTPEEYEELYGDLDDEFPLDEFQKEFPESMQSQINENRDDFGEFIGEIIFSDIYREGESPFRSDQTKWEEKSEDELEIINVQYGDSYEDMNSNFPNTYHMDFGEYRSGNDIIDMKLCYTKIEGRYYMIYFVTSVGSVGG